MTWPKKIYRTEIVNDFHTRTPVLERHGVKRVNILPLLSLWKRTYSWPPNALYVNISLRINLITICVSFVNHLPSILWLLLLYVPWFPKEVFFLSQLIVSSFSPFSSVVPGFRSSGLTVVFKRNSTPNFIASFREVLFQMDLFHSC